MKFISTRKFLRDYKEELGNMPLVVTNHGKPYFIVTEPRFGLTSADTLVDLSRVKEEDLDNIEMVEIYVDDESKKRYGERRKNEEIVEMLVNPEAQQDNVREILDKKKKKE